MYLKQLVLRMATDNKDIQYVFMSQIAHAGGNVQFIVHTRTASSMYFAKVSITYTITLQFNTVKLLPQNILFYKNLSELMHDINPASVPINRKFLS